MSNSNLESGSRASKRPDRTIEEATQLLNEWLNIANDYDVFLEHYDAADLDINREFLLAEFPSQEELQRALAEIKLLHATIQAGTTAQRDQSTIHYKFDRLVRLRNKFRGRFNRLHARLRALGLPDPGEDDETNIQYHTVSSGAVEPSTSVPTRGQPYSAPINPAFRPQHPIQTMAQVPVPTSAQPPIPTLAQRLMPHYRERSVSPPPPEPPLRFPSQHHPVSYHPGANNGRMRSIEDEMRSLQAENADLRGAFDVTQNHVSEMINLHKRQKEEMKAKDAEIERLKAELENEKNRKK